MLDPVTGRLPFKGEIDSSVYRGTLSEVAERFSAMDGEPRHRTQLLAAFIVWYAQFRRLAPATRIWLSGSYLSTKPRPNDVDVLVWLDDPSVEALFFGAPERKGPEYFTNFDVFSTKLGGPYGRVQPIAGLVDVHLVQAWLPENVQLWREFWTTEFRKGTSTPTGIRMGVMEMIE